MMRPAIVLLLLAQPVAAQLPTAERALHLSGSARIAIADAGPNGAWDLTDITQVHPLADDGLLVATATELHRFSASGGHVAMLGRAGEGPGEFRGLNGIAVCPSGEIIATDWIQQRVTTLPAGRGNAHVVRYPAGAFSNGLRVLGCDNEGVVLRDGVGSPHLPRTLQVDTEVIYRAKRDLSVEQVSLRVPGNREFEGLQQPFGATTLIAWSGNALVVCNSADSVVRIIPRGAAPRTVTLQLPARRPVTAAMRAAMTAQEQRDTPPAIWTSRIQPIFSTIPWPAFLPRWSELLVDDQQRVWLREYRPRTAPEAAPNRWHVVGADGHLAGALTLAATDRLLAVNRGEAVLVRVGIDGQAIEVRRITGW